MTLKLKNPVLPVRITIYHAAQDDPKKNTALKTETSGFARIVTKDKVSAKTSHRA